MEINRNLYKIYNFISWRQMVLLVSIFFILISCVTMVIRGFNWGVDFTGGMFIYITLDEENINLDTKKMQGSLMQLGLKHCKIQNVGMSRDIVIRLPSFSHNEYIINQQSIKNNIESVLLKGLMKGFFIKKMDWIGPSISDGLIKTGIITLIVTLMSIFIYITIRFEWRLALGAVISLVHDIIIIGGFLSFFSIEIDITIIAALISAISYSLNDNIIIFDRIRENFRCLCETNSIAIFNFSLSQVLNRTIITSVTTVMVLLILFFFGGSALYGFSVTLLIGVIIGTISSIYVASILAFELGVRRKDFVK